MQLPQIGLAAQEGIVLGDCLELGGGAQQDGGTDSEVLGDSLLVMASLADPIARTIGGSPMRSCAKSSISVLTYLRNPCTSMVSE